MEPTILMQSLKQTLTPCKDLPITTCETCKEPLAKDYMVLGEVKRFPIICECKRKEIAKREKREEFLERQHRLDKFKSYSLMDENFKTSTFENWKTRPDNQSLLAFGKKYCTEWETMKANNRGVLLYGGAGCGKTFLSFAIANKLYNQGVSALAISVSRILRLIQDGYSHGGEMTEISMLNTLFEAELLILDDLGTENKTAWSYEKLYSIIDTRYRARKPTFITTNLSIDELKRNLAIVDLKTKQLDSSHRIYNRIIEMCTLVELKGMSWRIQKSMENKKAMFEELGYD